MQVSVVSFGYKHGLPADADLVFDVRFLPNPFYVEDLRPLTGRDEPVADYVLRHPATQEFLGTTERLTVGRILSYRECVQCRSQCAGERYGKQLIRRNEPQRAVHNDADERRIGVRHMVRRQYDAAVPRHRAGTFDADAAEQAEHYPQDGPHYATEHTIAHDRPLLMPGQPVHERDRRAAIRAGILSRA